MAYLLADAGVDLPEAEKAVHGAAASLEAESTGWTLTEAPYLLQRKQALLGAVWDTVAWVLYKQGKFAEAFGYADAAAYIDARTVVHEHLMVIAKAIHTSQTVALAGRTDQKRRTFSLGPAKGRHGAAEFRFVLAGGKVVETGPPATNSFSSLPSSGSPDAPPFSGAELLLKAADLHSLFPPGSTAHLVRSGFVNCHADTCELVLAP